MSDKEAIINFLNREFRKKGDFLGGCALLRRLGADDVADDLEKFRFSPVIPAAGWARLFQNLEELAIIFFNPLDVLPRDVPADDQVAGSQGVLRRPTPTAPTEALAALRAELKQLMKRRAFLHSRLVFTSEQPPGGQRKKKLHAMARQLMEEVQPPIDRIIEKLDHIEATGEVPADVRPPAFDAAADLIRRRNSRRSSLSRYRALLKQESLDDKTRAHYEKRVIELTLEVQRLHLQIEGK